MEELGYSAAIAPIIPFIVSLIKNRRWPASVNMAIVAAVAFGVATVTLLISGQVDLSNGVQDPTVFFGAAAVAFTEATVLYRLLIKRTVTGERVNEKLTNVIWTPPPEATPLGEGEGLSPAWRDAVDEDASRLPPPPSSPEGKEVLEETVTEGKATTEHLVDELAGAGDICPDCGFGPRHPKHIEHTQ